MAFNVAFIKNAQPINEPAGLKKVSHEFTQPLKVNLLRDNACKPKLDLKA